MENYVKKQKLKDLKKIPASYENRFYKDLGNLFNKSFVSNFQHEIISDALSEDVKNYFLATCWVEKMGGKNLFLVGKKETSKIAVS